MNRTTRVLCRLLIVPALAILVGCGKEKPITQDGSGTVANPATETDLASRPFIVSQPAPNRREWIIQALQQGYRDTSRSNAAWDDAIKRTFEAFADYSRVSTTNWSSLKQALGGVPANCDDPMIQYLRVRYSEESQSKEKTAADFVRAHEVMFQSMYHPLFKFFAGMRAAQSGRDADKKGNRGEMLGQTTASLVDLARDTNAPIDEVFDAAGMWLNHSRAKEWIKYVTSHVDGILERNWGKTERWFRYCGDAEVWRAWGERGGGWATAVTEKGFEGFEEHLAKAEKALTTAWQMNPNHAGTAYLMMQVELGQGQGRSRMDLWFQRTMALETNHYDAVKLMSFYLEPRWYGSDSEALDFGRSCVASTNWGGEVPLILAKLHHSLAKYHQTTNSAYWHRPQVWRDVKSSYGKFFVLNPDAAGWRHDFAKDAYDCGQPSVFLEQTKLFAFGTNYAFFGGQERFDEMLESATQAVKRP
jgi:hypothetical protein